MAEKSTRNPLQTHSINESDCEVLQLSPESFLATTTDTVSEEIALGLYKDPFLMGWVAAQSSLSDLAAVGAKPLGLLFSTIWAFNQSDEFKTEVANGFTSALRESQTFLLGGDEGSGVATVLTGVGIGMSEKKPLSRVGIQVGDYFCLTGKTGCGPALAFRFLLDEDQKAFPERNYRPIARVNEGIQLRSIATAMMDTSDGVLSSLNTLSLINQVGIQLIWNPAILAPIAVEYCQARNIPLWLLWLGEHGDFELLVSIPKDQLKAAQIKCPSLQVIGQAVADPKQFTLSEGNKIHPLGENINVVHSISSGYCSDNENLSQNLSQKLSEALKFLIKTSREAGLP